MAGATKAAEAALASAQPGELVLLQADTVDETVQWLRGYLAMLAARTPTDAIKQVLIKPCVEPALVSVQTVAVAGKNISAPPRCKAASWPRPIPSPSSRKRVRKSTSYLKLRRTRGRNSR